MTRTSIKKSEHERFAHLIVHNPDIICNEMGVSKSTVLNYVQYAKASSKDRPTANKIYCKLGKKLRRMIDKVLDHEFIHKDHLKYVKEGFPKQTGPQANPNFSSKVKESPEKNAEDLFKASTETLSKEDIKNLIFTLSSVVKSIEQLIQKL